MKIQVKTLNQKTLVIEIDEAKTVYDLKKELSLYPDIGVQPELQKLIYSGKILKNSDSLTSCEIDVKKYLVVMVLKHPVLDDPPSTSSPTSEPEVKKEKTEEVQKKEEKKDERQEAKATKKEEEKPKESKSSSKADAEKEKTEQLVQQIVSMGYVESDVRAALLASYNNAERAIEYLIEGKLPDQDGDMDFEIDDEDISPFEMFRHDPMFRQLRESVRDNPDLINDAILRIAEVNPSIMNLINDNHQDFARALLDTFDDDSDDSDMG